MEKTIKKDNEITIVANTALGTELCCSIMEATGRFEFLRNGSKNMLIFWDNYYGEEQFIFNDWTLEKLMRWIVNFYSEDFLWRGEEKTQLKMRNALGLNN